MNNFKCLLSKMFFFLTVLGWSGAIFAQPVITSFSPATGPIGTTVAITGTGFNATPAQNIVFFGATKATVTAASATSLTVIVPLGATYQYISVTNLGVNLTAYSVKPFIVTFPGNIAFAGKVDFTTGLAPNSVSTGDIDGDFKPDLAVANTNSNTVSLFRNISTSGAISFAAKVDFTTGLDPFSVSIGDIDGDGKPDLAVANTNSNTVSVFRNTSSSGAVSFAAKVDFTTGTGPYSVNIGDIDGDGKPDLAVANTNSNTVSVFRNTSTSGTISFATKVDFTTGTGPFSVSIGDIDSDGKTDLAVSNISSNTVSVFRNTSTSGTISFASKVDFTTGSAPYSVSIGDIDGDGKTDLALANTGSNTVSLFRNTSTSGTISFASKVDFTTSALPISVSIGDIDGDGKPDLAVANSNSNTVSLFRNTSTSGTISFASKVDFTTGLAPYSVSIGDIDGDGKTDLAVANNSSNTVSVIQQITPPPIITSFSPAIGPIGTSVVITGTGFNATAAQNIVFFGATQATVIAASATSLTVIVPPGATYQYISVTNLGVNLTAYSAKPFIVTFTGNIVFAGKQDFTTGVAPYSVSIGDIDGDGKTDLAVANIFSNTVSVFRNTSTSGAVSFAAKVDFTTGTYPYSVSIGEIDGDGKPDLAVANNGSNTVSVFRNTSTSGAVSFAAKVDITTGITPRSVSIGDIDGDGKHDLAVANETSNTVSLFRNTSTSGTINFASKVDFTTGTNPFSVSIGDIDGDSKSDLAVANPNSNTVSLFRNTSISGTISFAPKVDFTTDSGPASVNIGDLDGDGKPDLAEANINSNTVSVFLNTSISGTISFASKVDFTTGINPRSVSIGDIDGDGKPDLAMANYSSNTVSVFRNTSNSGTISFASRVDFITGTNPTSVSIGDIDGDGKTDLAVANGSSNTVSVFRQTTPPTLTSFSPASGSEGTVVTISGTDLSNPTAFTIGGTPALVISNNGTIMVGMVMPGATTGIISLTTASGTVNSGSNFTVTPSLPPVGQQGSKLSGNDITGTPNQGMSISISADGNTAIVGASGDNFNIGAAWIYIRTNGIWAQQGTKLVASDYNGTPYQGGSVAISADGNTALVGGYNDNSFVGAAWVYTRSGNIWTQQGNKLIGTGYTGLARQGWSVSLSADGNTALVGGRADNSSLGAVWIFTRSGSVWTQQGIKLVGTGSIGASFQGQSASLSADGNTAIVGGYADNTNIGAAWVFTRSGSTWAQQGSKLVGTGYTGSLIYQGYSVSLSADGNTAIIGGQRDNAGIGAAWVFTRSGSTWSQQGNKLVGTGYTGTPYQASSVSISVDGNIALIGGPQDNFSTGAIWIYTRSGSTWSQPGNKLVGTGNTGAPGLGSSVSLSADGSTAIAGGPNDDNYKGAAWVFTPLLAPLATAATNILPTGFNANWNVSAGATGYYFDVDDNNDFSSPLINNLDVANLTNKAVTGLTSGTNYYYRVRAYDANSTSVNSNVISLTTIQNQTITFNSLSTKTYGDVSFSVSATGGGSGNPVTFTSQNAAIATCSGTNGETISILNAGTVKIYANQAGNVSFDAAAQVEQTLTINVKPITVTANAGQNKVYGSADPAFTYIVSPSLIDGDSFTGALTRAAGENVGSYAIGQGTLSAGTNYSITYASNNFAITAKLVTVTANAGQNKVYGSADPAFTYTVSPSLIAGDSFTGALTRAAGENVGSYAIGQGTLSAGTNYSITYASNNLAITEKLVTVTANAGQNKVYGSADPAFTYTVSPSLIAGDSFTGALTRAAGENVGSYAIGQGTLSAGTNYSITYASNNLAITAKLVTVTANAGQNKVYGSADPVFTYTVSPSLIAGDSFTGALTRAAGENVGSYAIGQGTLSAGTNYSITYASNNLAITAKLVTVTANAGQNKVYGSADPAFTYTVSPSLIAGDSFTGALTRAAGENVGSYAIGQGTLSAGTNYSITYASNNLAITAKLVTVTANAGQDKIYGSADPAFTYTVSPSLIAGDSFTGALTRAAGENVGSYVIGQGTLNTGTNYTITFVSVNFTITANLLTITGLSANNKIYDGTTAANLTGGTLSDIISDDEVSLILGTGVFNDKNSGLSKAIICSGFALTGADAGNYSLNQPSGVTADIIKATPVITWSNPSDIEPNTALSSIQLNASANISGTFIYTPVEGTILSEGSNQLLSAEFTPSDALNYNNAIKTARINVIILSGIGEFQTSTVAIYPNPTSGILNLSGLSNITNNITVSLLIIDNTGKTTMVKKLEKNINSETIDFSSLTNGIYYIVFQTNKERIVRRFVKQ